MKNYSIKDLNEKLEEILKQDPQEMLEYELIHINEETLCEMAHIYPKRTNLPVVIWADGPRNMKHGFRIKFQNSYSDHNDGSELIPITISDKPEIPKSVHTRLRISEKQLQMIKDWIVLNKDILIKYGQGVIDTGDLMDNLKPL